MDALDVLCAHLMNDLFAIAKFLFPAGMPCLYISCYGTRYAGSNNHSDAIDDCRSPVVSFYRAMLCTSADYAVARCLSLCPPVRLSVTRLYCVKRRNMPSNIFHRRVATLFYTASRKKPDPYD